MTYSVPRAGRCSNMPSGKVVRLLEPRYLWVSRKRDDRCGDDILARDRIVLPNATDSNALAVNM